ncbi:hypothetical protein P4654_24675 [Niallia taxi]|uniref:hypothetical protein n=1 Tax=Niallia taxi TaxID=2499688 RepID=UPI002E1CF464|nr:hypothetical protein [Niallia taxi]MED4118798.1 hypothetical protein [Niallia taxi]
MSHVKQHEVSILDYEKTGHQTIFVQFLGMDAITGKNFAGEVKFVGSMPYGDLIHPKRTFLSTECREHVQAWLIDKYCSGAFN